LLNDLSQRIDIEVAPQPTGGGENAVPSKVYTISFDDNDRDRSLKVVKILLDSFMEGTLGGKRKDSEQAQRFVEAQIREYEAKLSEAEQRLAEFKKRNVGMVPGDSGDYFTRLQSEIDAEKKTRTTLEIAITRRAALGEQLRGEAPVAASSLTMTAGGAGVRGGDTLSRIQETQAKLDDMLLRFTDKHPDVIALRQTLADLKARRAVELEALKRGDAGAAVATGASANPVYQSIQLQLNQADVEIAALRRELVDHQAKIGDLRRMVDTQPQVEAVFARLNLD
jgi:polysaccharide chain length determinant protein (PEP-CTERM system associated)